MAVQHCGEILGFLVGFFATGLWSSPLQLVVNKRLCRLLRKLAFESCVG